MGCATRVLELYGLRRFLAEIDAGRGYGPTAPGEEDPRANVIRACLDWAATEGFEEIMAPHSEAVSKREGVTIEYKLPMDWRERHLLRLTRVMEKRRTL